MGVTPDRIGKIIWSVSMLAMPGIQEVHAASAAAPTSQHCVQLGGNVPCKLAETSAWTYHALKKQFPDEAAVYDYLMTLYGPNAFFKLAYRWNQSSAPQWRTEFIHSIESTSWKVYDVCMVGLPAGVCERNQYLKAYQRTRDVTCPYGYQFGPDPASPYCMPR